MHYTSNMKQKTSPSLIHLSSPNSITYPTPSLSILVLQNLEHASMDTAERSTLATFGPQCPFCMLLGRDVHRVVVLAISFLFLFAGALLHKVRENVQLSRQ